MITFKTQVSDVVATRLGTFGYDVVKESDVNMDYPWGPEVWFTKSADTVGFRITFQPYVLSENLGRLDLINVSEFTVNFYRNIWTRRNGKKVHRSPDSPEFFGRLGSWLWIRDRTQLDWEPEHWYHFQNSLELKNACNDAVQKIIQYGIPWIEDLGTTPS